MLLGLYNSTCKEKTACHSTSLLLALVRIVHLVCFLNGPEIGTIGLAPYFDPLMNQ